MLRVLAVAAAYVLGFMWLVAHGRRTPVELVPRFEPVDDEIRARYAAGGVVPSDGGVVSRHVWAEPAPFGCELTVPPNAAARASVNAARYFGGGV